MAVERKYEINKNEDILQSYPGLFESFFFLSNFFFLFFFPGKQYFCNSVHCNGFPSFWFRSCVNTSRDSGPL